MRERDIEKHLVARVKALGGEVRKVQWIGRRGAPDRLVMLPPRWARVSAPVGMPTTAHRGGAIWVELKAPGEDPTTQQLREHERMRVMCQCVVVINSIEGVDALLT